ncbi:MAG: hypothetical protein U0641_18705 [Anaerolineae bacterium]
MLKLWKIVIALALVACASQVAAAQSPTVVLDGDVVNAAGQPAHDTLVVVFLNSHEIGRGETQCDAAACHFEISVPNDSGIGTPGPDGVSRVHVGTIAVKTPKVVAAPSAAAPRHPVYAILALNDTATDMPPEMKEGQLGLLPDGGVTVIGPTRAVEPSPAAASGAFSINSAVAALAALLVMGTVCFTSLVVALVAVGWLVYRWRRADKGSPSLGQNPPD